MVAQNLEFGDLVWAKMKRYPYWPAKIVKPPADPKSTPKKAQHYVYFFGSKNFAWISDENIVLHSDEMLQSSAKKKTTLVSYKLAIEEISKESLSAPKKAKSPATVKESPEVVASSNEIKITKVQKIKIESAKKLALKRSFFDESEMKTSSVKESPEVVASRNEIKIAKAQKIKIESPKIPKKFALKRSFIDESAMKRSSPPRKLSKKTADYSALLSNTPPNIGYNRVAVIKPLDDRANSLFTTGLTCRKYYDLQPGPSLDLRHTSENIQAKNIKATNKKIGFIGLGMMGQRLVKNLITSGHNVTIWNRTPEKCLDFIAIGASCVQTPSDVVERCDIIFCCVSGPEDSKMLVFGHFGILYGLEKVAPGSKGYVEMTTIDPTTSQEIAEAITHKGGRYLEAQISGSRELAEAAALLILGAGDRELFNTCESCFLAFAKNAYFLSCAVGSGSKMNLILSMLMGITNAALAEAMALVERSELSQNNLLEILKLGPLKSDLLLEKGNAMLERCFTTNTSLKYQQKDLNLALGLGNKCMQPMLLTAAANELFKHAKLLCYSEHDVSAVYLGAKY